MALGGSVRTSETCALLVANGHDDRASAAAASSAAVGTGNGCGASWRGGHGAGGVGVREVELAAIDGSVPVDRTILVPVSHVAVVDDAEIVGVFVAAGGELCSVEGQTTRDVGGRDGADRQSDCRGCDRDDGVGETAPSKCHSAFLSVQRGSVIGHAALRSDCDACLFHLGAQHVEERFGSAFVGDAID